MIPWNLAGRRVGRPESSIEWNWRPRRRTRSARPFASRPPGSARSRARVDPEPFRRLLVKSRGSWSRAAAEKEARGEAIGLERGVMNATGNEAGEVESHPSRASSSATRLPRHERLAAASIRAATAGSRASRDRPVASHASRIPLSSRSSRTAATQKASAGASLDPSTDRLGLDGVEPAAAARERRARRSLDRPCAGERVEPPRKLHGPLAPDHCRPRSPRTLPSAPGARARRTPRASAPPVLARVMKPGCSCPVTN